MTPISRRATIEGDLSKDFSPEETLKRVRCTMLLLRADAYRHETWGIVGAIDDDDLQRIIALVDDLQWVHIPGGHEIHIVQPRRYIDEVNKFVDSLAAGVIRIGYRFPIRCLSSEMLRSVSLAVSTSVVPQGYMSRL